MENEHHPARLLISSSRKPVSYVNLAKRFLQEHGEVQLSALGVAISSMVTLAEILKNKQLAMETRVVTSLEEIASDSRTRHKPKMSVVLVKSPQFDDIVAAEGARAYAHDGGGNGVIPDAAAATSGGGGVHHLRGGGAGGIMSGNLGGSMQTVGMHPSHSYGAHDGGGGSVHHLRGGGAGGITSGNLGGSMQTVGMHPGHSYSAHDGGNISGSDAARKPGGGTNSRPPPYRREGYLLNHPPQHQLEGNLPQHRPQHVQHRGDNSQSTAYSSGHSMPLPAFGRHQFSGGSYGGQLPDQFGQAVLTQPWTDVLPPPLPLENQPPGSQHPYLQQQMLQQHLAQQLSGMHGGRLQQQQQQPQQQPSISQQQQLVQQLENLHMGQQQHSQQPSQLQPQPHPPSSMPERQPFQE